MLIDCRELNSDQLISCDICIIGAGAAGITIAKSYLSSNLSVCLMESGDFKADTETQNLYKGWTEFNGEPKKESYLHGSRLRYFGGSTNHWAGWCRPLDPIDFKKKDWVNYSGWPIDESDLKPYYSRAAETVEIDPFKEYTDDGRGYSGEDAIINSANMCSKHFHFSPPTRFGTRYRQELIDAENIKVCINANAQTISLHENGDHVNHVRFETLTGVRFKVQAKVTVVATGGVENARLLLLSNNIQKNGIGNSHDQLGRYFMDHPHYPHAANILLSKTPNNVATYDRSKNNNRVSLLGFTDQMQQDNHLLNTAMQIVTPRNNPAEVKIAAGVISLFDAMRTGRGKDNAPFLAQLEIISELNPDPENRILLDNEVDRFGLQKSRLILNLTEQHLDTVTKSIELFAIELARISNGRLRIGFSKDKPTRNYYPANHHSGTTRMSTHPASGIVNADCRVHGVSNLFIAGSSVFPTTGFANPTFTIVALAQRLSDHIQRTLKSA
jgi:choline dehydrogenase-like flavoprotein